jgi:hypothetical protein
MGTGHHILNNAHPRPERQVLERPEDASLGNQVWRRLQQIDIIEAQCPRRRIIDPTDHVEHCCLACTVGPD